LSPVDRYLLPLLDGTRDRDALVDALLAVDRQNPIPIERDGSPESGEVERRDTLAELVDELPQRPDRDEAAAGQLTFDFKLLRAGRCLTGQDEGAQEHP
jgi:hypothetical protein